MKDCQKVLQRDPLRANQKGRQRDLWMAQWRAWWTVTEKGQMKVPERERSMGSLMVMMKAV